MTEHQPGERSQLKRETWWTWGHSLRVSCSKFGKPGQWVKAKHWQSSHTRWKWHIVSYRHRDATIQYKRKPKKLISRHTICCFLKFWDLNHDSFRHNEWHGTIIQTFQYPVWPLTFRSICLIHRNDLGFEGSFLSLMLKKTCVIQAMITSADMPYLVWRHKNQWQTYRPWY